MMARGLRMILAMKRPTIPQTSPPTAKPLLVSLAVPVVGSAYTLMTSASS
jgi:hypothetical protein